MSAATVASPSVGAPAVDRRRERFARFCALGGKFRLSVTGRCNLRCFFCHNEGMPPVDRPPAEALDTADLVAIGSAFARLGGRQLNVTGGEPLLRADLPELLEAIDRGAMRIALNTNALLHARLTGRARIAAVDHLLVSLHTVDGAVFRRDLARQARAEVADVLAGVRALDAHGYRVKLNLSLGPHNAAGALDVVRWAADHGLDLKIIALVRASLAAGFYHGDWVDPRGLEAALDVLGAREETREQLGGVVTTWRLAGSIVELKNIARGRLRTTFCDGCPHLSACGEGIYGLRLGVDGVARPCLLRRERFAPLDRARAWDDQILDHIDAMVGDFERARFDRGAPT